MAVADIDAAGSEQTRDAGRRRGRLGRGRRRSTSPTTTAAARVVGELFDRHGDAFDVLVNVAGIDRPGYITDIDLADYRRVQAVNCEGPIFLTSEFMKRVQHLPEGRTADVVHIVSLSAITSGSGAIAYNGSKAGFLNATQCIQRELREKAVRLPDGTRAAVPVPRAGGHPGRHGHPDDGAVGHPGPPDDAAVGRGRDGADAAARCTPRPSCRRCRSCPDSSPTSPDDPQRRRMSMAAGRHRPRRPRPPDSGMASGSDAGEPGGHLGPGDLAPDEERLLAALERDARASREPSVEESVRRGPRRRGRGAAAGARAASPTTD